MNLGNRIPIRYYAFGSLLFGTLIVWGLLHWNMTTIKNGIMNLTLMQARTSFDKDILYRRWNAGHGGVYVPITEKTKPNPYLDIPDRDIQTMNGIWLTKLNPAYMTRQVLEMEEKADGIKGHLTSLNPIRPANKPDQWEENALKQFEKGKSEVSSVQNMNGSDYLRFMRPLTVGKGCLNCHARQGYKLGDLRGGLSVSIPLSAFKKIEKENIQLLYVTYGLLWLIGAAALSLVFYIIKRQIENQVETEKKLRDQEKLQTMIEMSGAVCHELNQPIQVILSASELIQYKMGQNSPVEKEVALLFEYSEKMGKITHKLNSITEYKTKKYLNGKIIDIEEASS